MSKGKVEDKKKKDTKGGKPTPAGGSEKKTPNDTGNNQKPDGSTSVASGGTSGSAGLSGGPDKSGTVDGKPKANDPEFYKGKTAEDAHAVEVAARLAFQTIAGRPFNFDGVSMRVGNIVTVAMNPSCGVVPSAQYDQPDERNAAINLAGFRLFSRLSAFTGRSASYGPQDLSTMILAFGEIISQFDNVKRMFGAAFRYNILNRSVPIKLLESMGLDAADFFANYADYVVWFNKIVTLYNSIYMVDDIPYFKKCHSLYNKIYMDGTSPIAQMIVPVPATTWRLDEISDPNGTVLKTADVHYDHTSGNAATAWKGPQAMSVYLTQLEQMVSDVYNSSTYNVVYTDILNYKRKASQFNGGEVTLIHEDTIDETYMCEFEYDPYFLAMVHNATITGPVKRATTFDATNHITPYNDVIPVPSKNALYYNPGISSYVNMPFTLEEKIVDSLSDDPTVDEIIEYTRYSALVDKNTYRVETNGDYTFYDAVLPDHYVVGIRFTPGQGNSYVLLSTPIPEWEIIDALQITQFDWAPILPVVWNDSGVYKLRDTFVGDLNFYTTVDYKWLKKLNDTLLLNLFDM